MPLARVINSVNPFLVQDAALADSDVLKMATADNAELLAMSGPRNPYPGKLGVIEQGALADLLLVDGDPIANIN